MDRSKKDDSNINQFSKGKVKCETSLEITCRCQQLNQNAPFRGVLVRTLTNNTHDCPGAPTGIRTLVLALKGLRPGPLDDGGIYPARRDFTIARQQGQGLFGNNRHFSPWIFADAFGLYLRMIAQLDVNNPPVTGSHRFQDLPFTSFDRLFSHPAG